MANRSPILLRPHWTLVNIVALPVVVEEIDGTRKIHGLLQIIVQINMFLDTLFTDKAGYTTARSLSNEQYEIFKSIEGILKAAGIDGKSCLLRTICEMQANPIGEFTVVGEILTILLTPKRGLNDFLHEYIEAEHIGQSSNSTCAAEYKQCPVSLYNLFRARTDGSNNLIEDDIEGDDDDENEDDDYIDNQLSHNNHSHDNHQLESSDHETADPFLLEKEHLVVGGINSV